MSIVFAGIAPHPPIIVPEIGKGEEKKIEKTTLAYNRLAEELALCEPDTIVVITPHTLLYSDMFNVCGMEKVKGNFLDFGFPEYKFKGSNNLPLATEIVDQSEAEGIAALLYNNEAQYYLDHGVMVPLYFITKYMKKSFKVLPIGYTYGSRAEHYMFGQLLAEVCEKNEGRIAIIASGDLSHHLNDVDESIRNTGFDFDKMIVKMVNSNDEHGIMEMETTTIAAAGECGYKSIITLLGAVSDQATDPEVYSYEGPFGVGYMVANMNVDKKMQI